MYGRLYRESRVNQRELAQVMTWALEHDGPESKLSDMPSPVHDIIRNEFGDDAIARLEMAACPWFEKPHDDTTPRILVQIADAIEALSWITMYGNGLKDKFDNSKIEFKLRIRVRELCVKYERLEPGITAVAISLMEEVAP